MTGTYRERIFLKEYTAAKFEEKNFVSRLRIQEKSEGGGPGTPKQGSFGGWSIT